MLHGDQARERFRRLSTDRPCATRTTSQTTDKYRKNYADEVRFIVNSSATDIYNKVEAGQLDLATSASRRRSCEVRDDPSLKPYFHLDAGDRTWYLTMNLTARRSTTSTFARR